MQDEAPLNLLRLKFGRIDEFTSYWQRFSDLGTAIWRWHETIGDSEQLIKLHGICDNCMKNTVFQIQSQRQETHGFEFRASWSSLVCETCGFDARDRHIISYLRDHARPRERLYHVGHYSKVARYIDACYPSSTLSQYEDGVKSGTLGADGVRYEDLTNLSLETESYKYIVCSEILEHIPDYKAAMKEMHRVLVDGGSAILTFPWLGGDHYDHVTRAERLPDGTIKHFLPAEYHGDPAKAGGILSFRSFGWRVLDELREAGFRDVNVEYKFGPLHGYMTLLAPIIVAMK